MRRIGAALGVVAMVLVLVAPAGATVPHPTTAIRDDQFVPVPTPSALPPIADAMVPATPRPTRPALPPAPEPTAIVVPVATKAPAQAHVASSGRSLSGPASWYCWPSFPSACAHGFPYGGEYAAAGPKLRAAMCGDQASNCWRGRTVLVNGWPIRLIDWCQCYRHEAKEKLIDLYHNVWVETHAQGGVTITW